MLDRVPGRRGAFVFWVGLVAVCVLAVYLYRARPWDPHLSADEATAQLVGKAHLDKAYGCEREQGNEVLQIEIGDIDYHCFPVHYEDGDVHYYIGTDENRITGLWQSAP